MNDLKVFNSTEFGELGVMLIDGKEYFPATQCAKILGYSNPQKAIRDHCKTDGCTKRSVIDSLGRTQQMKFITEGNLYRLIVSSKLPAAENFERWVFEEVLPNIRENGGYGDVNIEKVIAKTVSATVSEIMKQIAPIIVNNNVTLASKEPDVVQPKKKLKKSCSKISKLKPEIKKNVDEMLKSDVYTYTEICTYLESFGVKCSAASVCRYYRRLKDK